MMLPSMRLKRFFFYAMKMAVLSILLFQRPLWAETKEELTKCQSEKDCVLVEGDCGYASAVHRDHVREFKSGLSGVCDKSVAFNSANNTVKCLQNKCRVYFKIGEPAKRTCTKDSDCTFGLMGCWNWIAVNKKFVDESAGAFGGH